MNSDELLAVLDMTEEQQSKWVYANKGQGEPCCAYSCRECLAHIAFRLRDEVEWGSLHAAMQRVWGYWCKKSWPSRKTAGETKQHVAWHRFWMHRSKPIHWIIAALIAKESK